jgi:hypothetical protein
MTRHKFDILYNVLISNLSNAVTKYAKSDQCGDKTTWGHSGYAWPEADWQGQ